MFRCITTKKNKHLKTKIPMNMNIKNIGKKKTVTHITNHIFTNYWVTRYSVEKYYVKSPTIVFVYSFISLSFSEDATS